MSNKIIKVSIVLIFMLFSSCLFNFCFAAISESDLEVVDTIVSYNDSGTTTSVPLYKSNFSYIECPTENKYKLYYYDTYDDLLKCFVSNKPLVLLCNRNDWRLYLHEVNEDGSYGVLTCDRYTYNSNTAKWSYNKTFNAVGNMNISECLWLVDYSDPNLYGYATSENTELVQLYPQQPPSIEELIAGCDFKVNFKFNPTNSDFPADVDHHLDLYDECLVTHTMSNWSNYKVSMGITLNRKSQYSGSDTYFELYSLNGEKLIEKSNVLYNSIISSELSENDFYVLFSDNIDNIVKIIYYIHNYNNELLFSKEYTLKFSSGGFGSVDCTGTIITENAYDSNGDSMNKGNTSFETNGYDDTDYSNSAYDFDSLYKLDEESLKTNTMNLISSSADFFGLMSLFLYMLPNWIASLLYLFLFGMIIITLLRFARGS